MAVAAQDTLLPAHDFVRRAESHNSSRSSQMFTASVEQFLLGTGRQSTQREMGVSGGQVAVDVLSSAHSHPFQHDHDFTPTTEHAGGVLSWLRWIANNDTARQQFRATKPEKRLEYAVTMGRRDIFAQTAHQLYSYLDMHFNLSKVEYDWAGFIVTRNELETLVGDAVHKWGFDDFDAFYEFGDQFKQVLESPSFKSISRQIEAANPKGSQGNYVRQSLFSFFYVNELFPPHTRDLQGREARLVALHRLGLPPDTQYLRVHGPDREFVDGSRVGGFFTNWNDSYVRTPEQQRAVYRRAIKAI